MFWGGPPQGDGPYVGDVFSGDPSDGPAFWLKGPPGFSSGGKGGKAKKSTWKDDGWNGKPTNGGASRWKSDDDSWNSKWNQPQQQQPFAAKGKGGRDSTGKGRIGAPAASRGAEPKWHVKEADKFEPPGLAPRARDSKPKPSPPAVAAPTPTPSGPSWAAIDLEAREGVAEVTTAQTGAAVEDEVDDWPVRKALRQGKMVEALRLVADLPKVSSRVAERVLTALGKSPQLSQEVMDKLLDLEGRFDADALAAAATEAQQRADAASCYQMYLVSGLLGIQRTDAVLASLLQGQLAEAKRALPMVNDILGDSKARVNGDLAKALLSICEAAEDSKLLESVKARVAKDEHK
jgi:hypothetical protein